MAEKNVVGSSGAGGELRGLEDPEKLRAAEEKAKAKEEARFRKRIADKEASRARKAAIMGKVPQTPGEKDSDKKTEAETKKKTEAETKKVDALVAEMKARQEASRVLREAKKKDAEKKDAEKKKVLVPIANGTDVIEAVVTIDVLRRAGAKVTVASVESQVQVDFSYRVKIVADALLSECAETVFDVIAFPGGIPDVETLKYRKTLENMVKNQAAENRHCAVICDAHAIAFGSRDLLTGMKATCSSFMELLSSIATATESRVEKDNNVVTSRGPGTAIKYAIALVEQLYDGKKATELSEELIVRSNHVEEYAFADLNPVTWTYAGSPQILVPVADGSEEMEVVIIVAVLRRAGAEVVVASVEGKKEGKKERKKEIVGNYGVKLVADMLLDEVVDRSFDLIVLPGELGDARAFRCSDELIELLKKQKESNRPYGGICASPVYVFEDHGLLKGKKATAHPCMWDLLWDDSEAENRVVVDGYVATSQAPGTSMEYALVLVEKFFGREKAIEVAKEMVGNH